MALALLHLVQSLVISDNDLYFAPSGVQKEKINPEDIFVCSLEGSVKDGPDPEKGLKQSQCTPLFMEAYKGTQKLSVT